MFRLHEQVMVLGFVLLFALKYVLKVLNVLFWVANAAL